MSARFRLRRPATDSLVVAALLTGISTLAPLSIDMFLPSLPVMTELFGTSAGRMKLSVTIFVAAFAASQLVFGPLSDRFGRRPALLGGMALYALGGLVCLSSLGVIRFIAGRVLQGIAAGSGPSVGRATIRDIYGRERSAKVMSYMAVAMSLAPMLAPVLGGFLQTYFGWHSVFVVLSGLGSVFFLGYWLLVPETNLHTDKNALNPSHLKANIALLLRDRRYMGYTMVMALMFCGHLVFISSSSFVLISVLGLSPQMFGLSFGLVAFGIMIGAFLAGKLSGRFSIPTLVMAGTLVNTLGGGVMVLLGSLGIGGAWGIVLPMVLITMGGGLARSPAVAGAIIPFPRMAGLASALMGFVQMSSAAAYASLFSLINDGSPQAMTSAIGLGTFLALGCYILLTPKSLPPRNIE